MLEVDNLSRKSGDKTIVGEVSFKLATGKSLTILGPSGSGKTSLLRLLAGLDRSAQGTVRWNGTTLSDSRSIFVEPEDRRFTLMFQEPVLFPHLNVLENVAFGVRSPKASERAAVASKWLNRFELQSLARRKTHFLSGGEQQRVALARAFAYEPEVLLLDEPFASIDRVVRAGLIKLLGELAGQAPLTVILVTHDARDAVEFGTDSILIMNQGLVVQQGPVGDVLHSPADPWTREFLRASFGPTVAM